MANDNNLIPQNKRTKSEQREIARLGGMVSGEMRRQRKSMREAMQIGMFELELPENEKNKLKSAGVKNEKDMDNQMAATIAMIKKAKEGDVQAYNAICAMLGEKPADKMELSGGLQHEITIRYVGKDGDEIFPSSEDEVDAEK
jgi:hypothetical protein